MRSFIQGIKNLIKWFPTIWKDRDHDYYYTMEVLKKKLEFQAKSMKECSLHANSSKYTEQLETCVILLEIVQNETYIEELIDKLGSTDEDLHNAIVQHEKARRKFFDIMEENIENWWY
jgi:hypothetical protein